jgi:FkbM family methyltransferase
MKIVQIGTCVGGDDVTEIIQKNEVDFILLVEPMSIHNDKIMKCYKDVKNIYLENIAITDSLNEKEISFYYHENDGPKYEVASVDKNHILKHGYGHDGIVELKIPCMTLNDLFEKHNLKNIDVLFIDTEGMDDRLIKSINFEKYNINRLYFENLHIKDQNIYSILNSLGYKITHNVGFMGWSSLAEKNI